MSTSSLRGRDLVSAADLSADEIGVLFARAAVLKSEYALERRHASPPLERRTLAMLFQKPSLRTRATFEAGMTQLGGHAIYLTEGVVLGGRETVGDVARNLERFVDGIMARTGRGNSPRHRSRPASAGSGGQSPSAPPGRTSDSRPEDEGAEEVRPQASPQGPSVHEAVGTSRAVRAGVGTCAPRSRTLESARVKPSLLGSCSMPPSPERPARRLRRSANIQRHIARVGFA